MISHASTLWSLCICPFAMYAHALSTRSTCLVIAGHVIKASDLVIPTSCLHPLISCAFCVVPVVGMSCPVPQPARGSQVLRMSTPANSTCRFSRKRLRHSLTGSPERPLPRLGKHRSPMFAVMSASLAVSYRPAAAVVPGLRILRWSVLSLRVCLRVGVDWS